MTIWAHTHWLHFGNMLFLSAYSVRDILWLRILTVAATACLLPYYFCCSDDPLYEPILWNSLFIAINLVQITVLILEKRPVFLGEEELTLYRTVFRTLSPREFTKLLSIAHWKRALEGDELLKQDRPVAELLLISSGQATVEMDGRHVAHVYAGQFVGEMGYLTDQDASARVVAAAPTDCLAWPAEKLRSLLINAPGLMVKVQGVLGFDLVAKLRQEGLAAAHPSRLPMAAPRPNDGADSAEN